MATKEVEDDYLVGPLGVESYVIYRVGVTPSTWNRTLLHARCSKHAAPHFVNSRAFLTFSRATSDHTPPSLSPTTHLPTLVDAVTVPGAPTD